MILWFADALRRGDSRLSIMINSGQNIIDFSLILRQGDSENYFWAFINAGMATGLLIR